MEATTLTVRPGALAAVLLGVAVCSYLLGATSARPQQQYATAAPHTTLRTWPLVAAHLPRLGQAAGPVSDTALLGVVAAPPSTDSPQTQAQPWLLPVVSLGSVVVGALLFAWTRARQGASLRRPLADEWRAAAVELEEGFPGPGNPNDEFE
eukprot:EG_transcript_39963